MKLNSYHPIWVNLALMETVSMDGDFVLRLCGITEGSKLDYSYDTTEARDADIERINDYWDREMYSNQVCEDSPQTMSVIGLSKDS